MTSIRMRVPRAALAGCAIVGAVVCAQAGAVVPSSARYVLPASATNSGTGDSGSASFGLSATAGAPFHAVRLAGAAFGLRPGFQSAAIAVLPGCLLDIDGNGSVDALTDGLMVLRAMFGLTGASVTNGAVGAGAQWTTWAEIQPRIHFKALDIDGNGTADALTDGLMILRALFGLTGTAVTNGAVGAGAPRATWADIRAYLNTTCATSLAP